MNSDFKQAALSFHLDFWCFYTQSLKSQLSSLGKRHKVATEFIMYSLNLRLLIWLLVWKKTFFSAIISRDEDLDVSKISSLILELIYFYVGTQTCFKFYFFFLLTQLQRVMLIGGPKYLDVLIQKLRRYIKDRHDEVQFFFFL